MGAIRKTGLIAGFLGIGAISALSLTNPHFSAYEQYATVRLSAYVETLCDELPLNLGNLNQQCKELVISNQAVLQGLIQNNTQRLNCILFSIYQTTFEVPGMRTAPAYRVETLGIFNHFFTYRATRI